MEDDAGEVHHPDAKGCVPPPPVHEPLCPSSACKSAEARGAFIAKGTSVAWPPRSPDLTPPAFYLWGHVKERTYKREPRNLPELKAAVKECVRAVTELGSAAEFSQKCSVESKSVWPEMGDTPINCSGFKEEVQTVMTNDGYEFPMFTDKF